MQSTAGRVPAHTAAPVNRAISRTTEANIQYYAAHLDEIEERLNELDREWDIERTVVPAARYVGGFLLQHAVEGWCPPLPVFRRMGVRT
jgi:hypothetical protein